MRLSMWILKDYLKEYDPVAQIRNGQRVLRNVRLLSEISTGLGRNVYVAQTDEYINGTPYRVMCVHDQDILLLKTDDMETAFNRILDCFDYYNMWADSCYDLIRSDCELHDLLELTQPIFGEDIAVISSSHIIIDYVQSLAKPENLDAKAMRSYEFSRKVFANSSMSLRYIQKARQNQMIFRATSKSYIAYLSNDLSPNMLVNLFQKEIIWGWILVNSIF